MINLAVLNKKNKLAQTYTYKPNMV